MTETKLVLDIVHGETVIAWKRLTEPYNHNKAREA